MTTLQTRVLQHGLLGRLEIMVDKWPINAQGRPRQTTSARGPNA